MYVCDYVGIKKYLMIKVNLKYYYLYLILLLIYMEFEL